MTRAKLLTSLAKTQSKLEKRINNLEIAINKLRDKNKEHKTQKRLDAEFKDYIRENYIDIYKEAVEKITNKKFDYNGEFIFQNKKFTKLKETKNG